jgi:dihydrofolate reductase
MRKVIFGGATTLDGYFARLDDSVDWLMWSDEAARIMADYWKDIDTILIGRKTYDVTRRMQSGEKKSLGTGGMRTYLFSRTLSESPEKGVTLVNGDGVEFVRQLKREPGKNIVILGGGLLGTSLLEGGVVDEVGFNIHPVLIGRACRRCRRCHARSSSSSCRASRSRTGASTWSTEWEQHDEAVG